MITPQSQVQLPSLTKPDPVTASAWSSGTSSQGDLTTSLPSISAASSGVVVPANTFNVQNFGAIVNDNLDDTQAIQTAIDNARNQGGGTLVFPAGEYIVTSVKLKDNIAYEGYGATIRRPANQPNFIRTFDAQYSGTADSQPFVIRGFTFDGNSSQQGPYQNYELEQSHLLFFSADSTLPGKLKAFVEDTTFKNNVGDGISVYTNVDIKVNRVEAIDVFRGGFVLTGGNSSADVRNLTTRGTVDDTGIDIEVDGKGFGDTFRINVNLENLNIINGDFDINVLEGSTINGNNIVADAPFDIFNYNSTMNFTNSKFQVGAADSEINRIVLPGNLTFENSEFVVTRKETKKPYEFFSAADIWWDLPSYSTVNNQQVTFKNSTFNVNGTITEADKTYAIHLRENQSSTGNKLTVQGGAIGPGFDAAIVSETKGVVRTEVANPFSAELISNGSEETFTVNDYR